MASFLQAMLDIHIVAGAVALLVFWVPLVTKKGARLHRRTGWVYVTAAATVAITGILCCGRLMVDTRPGHWRAAVFLAYVGVFAGESAQLGVRALRSKLPSPASATALDLASPLFLVAGGVGIGALGVAYSRILFVLFGALGVAQGAAHLRFWRTRASRPRERILAHMTAMGTSCITTITAFVVVNAPRLGMRTFDPRLWAAPIVVLAVALSIWRRHYAQRFAHEAAEVLSP